MLQVSDYMATFHHTELGATDHYHVTGEHEGKYVSVAVRKEIDLSIDIESVEGECVATHTGAYGQIMFDFQGHTWTGPGVRGGWMLDSAAPGHKPTDIALNADKTRAIRMDRLTWNRSDMHELHNKYFIRYDESKGKTPYWVELPAVELV